MPDVGQLRASPVPRSCPVCGRPAVPGWLGRGWTRWLVPSGTTLCIQQLPRLWRGRNESENGPAAHRIRAVPRSGRHTIHGPGELSDRTPVEDCRARPTLPSAPRSWPLAARSARRTRCCAGLAKRRVRRVPRPAWPHVRPARRVLAAVPQWRAEVQQPCRLVSQSLAVTTPRLHAEARSACIWPGSKSWPCFPLAGQNRDMWVASRFRC